MTREPRTSPRPAARTRAPRDPYGLLPAGTPIAAVLSVLGLVVVALVTLSLGSGQLPIAAGGQPGGSGNPDGAPHTPTPSNVVVVPDDPLADVKGSIVYAKAGNIWVQSGRAARQLTTSGRDSMPSFSPDGSFVYFVRTREAEGLWPVNGANREYRMDVPAVMRVPADGSGEPERLYDGRVDGTGRLRWHGWIRQPVLSPDGKTLALVTDLPDPTRSDVVLQFLNLANGKLTNPRLSEVAPLGHQDPAWRADGKRLLYVRNSRDGAKGTPALYVYNVENGRARALTGPGYLHPAWSPDGRWIAATKTSAFGTDIVILDASNGGEVLKVSGDGRSWAPTWSPAGDAIVFLHISGQVVDLRLVTLEGSGPSWTAKEPFDLTTSAGLDSISRPSWFVPADQLPTPSPAGSPGPSASARS